MSIKNIVLTIIGLTIVIGAYFAYVTRDIKLPVTPQEPQTTPLVSKIPVVHGTFTFLDRNFKFNVNENWDAPTSTVVYPKDVGDVSFAFKKKGTTCILAYASAPGRNIFDTYSQSSFSDRVVTTDNTHLDTSWFVHKDNLPQGFEFSDNQTLPGEVRFTRYPEWSESDFGEQGYFLLFDEKGGKVDPVCSADATAMLSTLDMIYPEAALDAKSEGFVYIGTPNSGVPSVRFQSDAGPTIYRVMDISMDVTPAPFVYNDKIYYSKGNKLFGLDVFTRNVEEIPVPVANIEVINDFFIQSGTVYYLSGKDCRGYKEVCSSDLDSYNLATNSSEVLAKGVVSRSILGFDAIEKKLYMRYVEGDAGCFTKTDEIYDAGKKVLSKSEPWRGCEGDRGVDKVRAEMTAEEKRFGYDRDDTVIRVEGRKLFKDGSPLWALGSRAWVRFSGYVPI